MLKKRSRVIRKEALMADCDSLLSPTNKYTKPNMSSFFNSPLLFTGLSTKGLYETDALKSPTSTLDGKLFSGLANPFWTDKNSTNKSPQEHSWARKLDSRGVGLGLVDALNDEETDPKFSKPCSRMVLFGSQLKIQIPRLSPTPPSSVEYPQSPGDFGIKTRNSQLELFSASPKKSPFGSVSSGVDGSPRVFTGSLSASEMESSEDYTCVITHGPNPKTTHIFDDCIVEDCCGIVGFSALRNESWLLSDQSISPSDDFLSFCYTCKKDLGQGKDIYIYRGEKAFCSRECRYQEIISEEGMDKADLDDSVKTCS
ncbi:Fcs-like zinc finger [Thalictrum thalictroides]|uniref:Fcs-like zinc finger n=1 Tax=Thalictrum thalictroides TaxID=46969 RepID=A0A7J6W1L3_THATH|nr:Fcs-like zinc finger [Thalictrum thalictroides]